MKKLTPLLIFIFFVSEITKAQKNTEDLTRYVNPLIGTKEMGHVFPGACIPFALVQGNMQSDHRR
jgi:putative alpha-1,2-mannosidase